MLWQPLRRGMYRFPSPPIVTRSPLRVFLSSTPSCCLDPFVLPWLPSMLFPFFCTSCLSQITKCIIMASQAGFIRGLCWYPRDPMRRLHIDSIWSLRSSNMLLRILLGSCVQGFFRGLGNEGHERVTIQHRALLLDRIIGHPRRYDLSEVPSPIVR